MKWLAGFAIAVVVLIFVGSRREAILRLDCVDISRGQCWIVYGTGGSVAVVNCGSERWSSARSVADALRRSGVNKIDAFFATRFEPDAFAGLADLRDEFPIGGVYGPSSRGREATSTAPGSKAILPDGTTLRLVGANGQITAIVIDHKQINLALVDRLDDRTVDQLGRLRPSVLILGYRASHNGAELGALSPDVAVLHSGRSRREWADLGLVKNLEGVCGRVYQTGRNGGVILRSDGRRLEVRVTYGRE